MTSESFIPNNPLKHKEMFKAKSFVQTCTQCNKQCHPWTQVKITGARRQKGNELLIICNGVSRPPHLLKNQSQKSIRYSEFTERRKKCQTPTTKYETTERNPNSSYPASFGNSSLIARCSAFNLLAGCCNMQLQHCMCYPGALWQ